MLRRDPAIIGLFIMTALAAAVILALAVQNYFKPESLRLPREAQGLYVYTDVLTGCQYLTVGSGGITPRMDGVKQVGCRK